MSEYITSYKGTPGLSYGLEYPVRYTNIDSDDGWVVYNFRTGKVYAKNLQVWEAGIRGMKENQRLGKPCGVDIVAIDSTP